jgi:hypothetical protein
LLSGIDQINSDRIVIVILWSISTAIILIPIFWLELKFIVQPKSHGISRPTSANAMLRMILRPISFISQLDLDSWTHWARISNHNSLCISKFVFKKELFPPLSWARTSFDSLLIQWKKLRNKKLSENKISIKNN